MQPVLNFLSVLTIGAQVFIAGSVILLVLGLIDKSGVISEVKMFISRYALPLAFITALAAVSGSLYLSEILHWIPCELCWFQRIFMYPQVIIIGLALIYKDKTVWRYILPLCLIGGAIALYHYLIQIYPSPSAFCSITSPESCTEILVKYYGYITIPMMSLTAFLFNAILGIFAFSRKNSSTPPRFDHST